MDRIQRLDEIAWVTDLKLIKYFNPHKGDSIKQDRHSWSNRTDDEAFYFCEESESEKTNLRDTETTYEHLKPPHDESIDHYCAMSLAVHFESKIESDNNPSIVTGKAKMKRTVSTGMPTSSCKPCCTIF